MNTPELSIVIPSYNEMANLQKGVLDKIEHFLNKQKLSYEVIISDDGSTDGSIEFVERYVADSPHFQLMKNPHLGKAGAVTEGMLGAKGRHILFTDMDQATPIEEIDKLMPFFEKYDIVIGSRHSQRKGAPLSRKIMANGNIFLRRLLVGISDISDTQCGFKMFKKSASDDLFKRLSDLHHGYGEIKGSAVSAGFDVELLFIAQKLGYSIKEVPVEWLYVETRRVSPITDSINGVKGLLRIFFNKLSGKYNI